jgi:hypothetical protein
MKRVLPTAVATIGLAMSMLVAHASTLNVDGGYLQVIQVEAPQNDQVKIEVVVYLRSGQSGNWQDPVTHERWIDDGYSYVMRLTSGTGLDCPGTIDDNPIDDPQGFGDEWGPFTVSDSPVTHTLCGQTGNFAFALDQVAPSGSAETVGTVATDAIGTETREPQPPQEATAPTVVRPDDIPDFVGENCQDGGWQQLAAADGQPYADEQACVDDQVRAYYAQQREGGS